ncbi:hypothetical protein [Martelella mediterranea]|nr:hypothetical protein [Martelella mediterranea]
MTNQIELYEHESYRRNPNLLKNSSKSPVFMAIVVAVAVSAVNLYLFLREPEAVKSGRVSDATSVKVSELHSEVQRLKTAQADLVQQLNTLTARNGVLERIIGHVNELKKQDEFILNELVTLQGIGGPLGFEAANGGVGVQHKIVTHPVVAMPAPDGDGAE